MKGKQDNRRKKQENSARTNKKVTLRELKSKGETKSAREKNKK